MGRERELTVPELFRYTERVFENKPRRHDVENGSLGSAGFAFAWRTSDVAV